MKSIWDNTRENIPTPLTHLKRIPTQMTSKAGEMKVQSRSNTDHDESRIYVA